jgi:hypothetical protein
MPTRRYISNARLLKLCCPDERASRNRDASGLYQACNFSGQRQHVASVRGLWDRADSSHRAADSHSVFISPQPVKLEIMRSRLALTESCALRSIEEREHKFVL